MKHCDQVLQLLKHQIQNDEEVEDIHGTAKEVVSKWVVPLSGGKEETNGLVYGLVQSGKTGVLTVTGAMGADEGYRAIVILTSDNDPLYEQTLGRVQEALPGVDVMGKNDFKDQESFLSRLKVGTCAIVTTKNASRLKTINQNLRAGKLRGLSCLIIDDEADQASPNTRASKADGTLSAINEQITELRDFFERNTYLQVTATPQALFLQIPGHRFRPKFAVLSHPGSAYVGGDDFFGDQSALVKEFNLNDIVVVAPGPQPHPRLDMPASLVRALDTFMIGATYKRSTEIDQNCAFLCHVSTKKADHKHIVDLLRKYKADLSKGLVNADQRLIARLRSAYEDLATTHAGLRRKSFDELVDSIKFFSPGIAVKLVNGETDEDVAVRAPYNLFVGGNKLGRGVTIKNLLVSYYGRHPKRPQADTVLQHARMYGYRRKDIGLLRLFLPHELHTVFRAIHKMERSLRDLIAAQPSEEFRGVFLEKGLHATRKNILAPGSIGVYSGGSNYNPAQILRDASIVSITEKIDKKLAHIPNKAASEMSIAEIRHLIDLVRPDQSQSEFIWNSLAASESLDQFAKIYGHETGFVYVDRDRGVEGNRRESAGIIEGGEYVKVPESRIALFLLRMRGSGERHPAWWPQVRFPTGRYAFAFSV